MRYNFEIIYFLSNKIEFYGRRYAGDFTKGADPDGQNREFREDGMILWYTEVNTPVTPY
jgi:hypothetical protein